MREGRYILIVDDEKEICLLLSAIVKGAGYETRIANSIEEAKLILSSELVPSLIFLDINLNDETGLELIPGIKKRFPSTEVVVISAYNSKDDISTAYAEGANQFISKPFSRKEIYETLERIN